MTYTRTAIALHWLIAAAVFAQLALGWWMIDIPKSPPGVRADWFNLHKSIGLTIALLVIARLAWRFTHRPPPLPVALPQWQHWTARANHIALYACLIVLPLSGYLGSSFTKYPIRYFGYTLPSWGWYAPELKELTSQVHYFATIVFVSLIALHVAAALKHLLVNRDGIFGRMWGWPPPRRLRQRAGSKSPAARGVWQFALLALLLAGTPVAATERAYVPNEASGTISVIDTGTDRLVGEIRAGIKPRGIAASRDGTRLYVSDQKQNALLVIDLGKGAVTGTIDLGESPEGVSISADGRLIAAASELANAVVLVDAATHEKLAVIKTVGKNPEHAVFSPDGRWLYVSAEDADQVDIVDVKKRAQVGSVQVGKRPRGIAFTPDGARAYVACELADTVYAIDVAKRTVLAAIPAGAFSNGVTMSPDGKRVYISNGRDASVSVIETQSNKIVATVGVGKRPWNMAITADGNKLYVANGRSNSVSVIDTKALSKLADIAVGERPWGVLIPPHITK